MSKSISPEEVVINPSDVVEQKAEEQTAPAEVPSEEAAAVIPDYSSKSLPELVEALQVLGACADRLQRSKEAEAIKSGFYKLLSKLKAEAQSAAQAAGAEIEAAAAAANSKFSDVEEKFKALYADYKRERAEFNEFVSIQDEKAQKLKDRLEKGLISQEEYDKQMAKMDEERDAREKALNHEQFEREKNRVERMIETKDYNELNSACPSGWQLTVNAASDSKSYYYLIRTVFIIIFYHLRFKFF